MNRNAIPQSKCDFGPYGEIAFPSQLLQMESQKTIVLNTLQDATWDKDRRFTIQLTAPAEVEISPVKGKRNAVFANYKVIIRKKCSQILSSCYDRQCQHL